MKNKYIPIVGAGTLLLWAIAYATMIASYPRIYSPYSFPIVVPVLLIAEVFRGGAPLYIFALGSLSIPALFLSWSYPLLTGQKQIPKRSTAAALTLSGLSAIFLLINLPYGVQYHGAAHTAAMYVFNCCFWTALFRLYKANSRQPSFSTNFLFHWTMFAWLGWVAFPWLGELP